MKRSLNIGVTILAFLATAALVATAVMVITADGEGENPQDSGVPAPIATPWIDYDAYIGEIPNSARDMPVLTENQIEEVKVILNSDGRLKPVLSGESFTIIDMGPWSLSSGELVGAMVEIELDNPIAYTGLIPGVGFPAEDKTDGGYLTGEVSVQAQGVESLELLVDLNRRVVTSIEISKAANISRTEYGKPQQVRGPITE